MADKKVKQEDCPVVGADKLVKFYVPKIPGDKNQFDFFVSVNGKNYLIQRGKEVTAPKCVRDEVMRALRASDSADEYYFSKASKSVK